jgi:alpha-soluble NSF attachment protein
MFELGDRLANKLFLKVGDLAAMETIPEVKEDKNLDKVMGENDIKYGKAIENFEKVARSSVSNNLMKWSVKDYFLKAGLCLLAIRDKSRTEKALEDYLSLDPTFLNTREHQLLVDLHEASHALDVDVFIAKLKAYEQMSSLDKWKVTMMLRIKTRMENADEDFS